MTAISDASVEHHTGQPSGVRILVAIDVIPWQAENVADVVASVFARVADEAGYLDSGDPITPSHVVAVAVEDVEPLSAAQLRGAYLVGIEGAADWADSPTPPSAVFGSPTVEGNCAFCGRKLPDGQRVYCDRICAIRDKDSNDE